MASAIAGKNRISKISSSTVQKLPPPLIVNRLALSLMLCPQMDAFIVIQGRNSMMKQSTTRTRAMILNRDRERKSNDMGIILSFLFPEEPPGKIRFPYCSRLPQSEQKPSPGRAILPQLGQRGGSGFFVPQRSQKFWAAPCLAPQLGQTQPPTPLFTRTAPG